MKNLIIALFLVFNLVGAQNNQNYIKNQLIVKLKESAFQLDKIDFEKKSLGNSSLDKLNATVGLESIQSIGNYSRTRSFLLIFTDGVDANLELKKFQKLNAIEYAELDYIAISGGQFNENSALVVPTDTYFNRQWGLLNTGTMSGIGTTLPDADVDMELAWDIQTGDPNMIIAVSDSGLKMNHPDIASRIWINTDEIAGNSIDDDGNGYIDDVNGWDWVNNDNNPTDDHGHGTNCTGIIGAIANNNSLYSGVNWNSKIMPLKVLNSSNTGSYSSMANSIFYAVDNGAKIVSMSIGGSGSSAIIADSINYADGQNVMLFFCMMNFNNDTTYYPAGYSITYPNVVAVGSTNPDDTRTAPFFWSATSGSNYGSHINVVAPGNFIYGLSYNNDINPNSYWGGTSQATPLVAGIASLIFAQNPALTPEQVRTILQNTAADEVGSSGEDIQGFDEYMGYGRVNAFDALQAATLGIDESNFQQEFQLINPIQNNELQIYSKGEFEGDYTISVSTIDGKQLFSFVKNISEGLNAIPFEYATGNYIISLKSERYSKVFKVTKK